MTGLILYSVLMVLIGMMVERLKNWLCLYIDKYIEAVRYGANRGRW